MEPRNLWSYGNNNITRNYGTKSGRVRALFTKFIFERPQLKENLNRFLNHNWVWFDLSRLVCCYVMAPSSSLLLHSSSCLLQWQTTYNNCKMIFIRNKAKYIYINRNNETPPIIWRQILKERRDCINIMRVSVGVSYTSQKFLSGPYNLSTNT